MDAMQWAWLAAAAVVGLGAGAVLAVTLLRMGQPSRRHALPEDWAISARPVFTAEERVLHRALTTALPQQVILAKLPLVRFCQPLNPERSAYWYELLQPLHVAFAVCSPNGRVLAAIDLQTPGNRKQLQRKAGALEACRIRYVICQPAALPSAQEIASWGLVADAAPPASLPARPAPAQPSVAQAGEQLARTVRQRRAERQARWQDSGFASDSFFAPDSRLDELISDLGELDGARTPGRTPHPRQA